MNGSLHNFRYVERRTVEREAGILLSPISAGAAMSLGLGLSVIVMRRGTSSCKAKACFGNALEPNDTFRY